MALDTGYSATVVLTLVVNGQRLALSHVGPSGLIVRDECEPIPPGDAEIHIRVDDSRHRQRVYLPRGVPGGRQMVQFSDAPF
jgi:hypothetical protein